MNTAGRPSADRTVAEVLVDLLARAGIRHVFGVAGSTIMPILDAIAGDGRVEFVGARYELSAAEMASGYARASARLGVVMTHVGPGVTSCVTAIAGAARDGIPLLLITGNEETQTLARQPYHAWPLRAVMDALTRFSYQITRPDELPHVLRRALGEAVRGITRPVHVDLPEDIALARVTDDEAASWLASIAPLLDAVATAPAVPISRPVPSAPEVERAVDLVVRARAPAFLVGEAAQRGAAADGVVARCEEIGIPYATVFGARGRVGGRAGYVGTIGRFGSRDTTAFLSSADVVVALGAELSDVDTERWRVPGVKTKIVAVHPDPGRIDRRFPPMLGVVADVAEFLRVFGQAYAERAVPVPDEWLARARRVNRSGGPRGDVAERDDAPLDAQLVVRAIEAAPDSWVVTMDPGFGALSLSASADFGGTGFLYPYGLGTMGFAIPNAIGATIADEVDGALAIVGDGAFFMSLSSLESIASLDVPVVVLVLDDGGFGSQRKKQQEAYGRNVGVDYDNPDIAAIAAALGIEASWVESSADIAQLCASLPGRQHGRLAVVRRARQQEGTWYEGSTRRR